MEDDFAGMNTLNLIFFFFFFLNVKYFVHVFVATDSGSGGDDVNFTVIICISRTFPVFLSGLRVFS